MSHHPVSIVKKSYFHFWMKYFQKIFFMIIFVLDICSFEFKLYFEISITQSIHKFMKENHEMVTAKVSREVTHVRIMSQQTFSKTDMCLVPSKLYDWFHWNLAISINESETKHRIFPNIKGRLPMLRKSDDQIFLIWLVLFLNDSTLD